MMGFGQLKEDWKLEMKKNYQNSTCKSRTLPMRRAMQKSYFPSIATVLRIAFFHITFFGSDRGCGKWNEYGVGIAYMQSVRCTIICEKKN